MRRPIGPALALALLAAAAPRAPAAAAAAASSARPAAHVSAGRLSKAAAARFAALALKCLHQEYPNHISHTLNDASDARPPHELTPVFYGCLDWHSDVHGHWLLVRLLRLYPDAPFAVEARTALNQSFMTDKIEGEVAYLHGAGRASFERPYGLAWLLELAAELRRSDDPDARRWSTVLAPLETEVVARLERWLPKLQYPIRVGEHDQTAFAFGLIWDWAGVTHDDGMRRLLADAAQRFYRHDRNCPLAYEPSGEDFLSPCLAEADFMRRVLEPPAFAKWLSAFLPQIPRAAAGAAGPGTPAAAATASAPAGAAHAAHGWLEPGVVTDRSDPKLAHLDGLNLSRAWMLEGIAHGLPAADARIAALRAAARRHADAALPAVTGQYYEGGHWLGTFAVYLTSRAGLEN
ncbi:MAG TPA: DUF2891 domain-containing protein [Steroidobacteraceae bacterium]|nr:DUF2891 domain-containing protein [Steroidobacteraceae bacterium]